MTAYTVCLIIIKVYFHLASYDYSDANGHIVQALVDSFNSMLQQSAVKSKTVAQIVIPQWLIYIIVGNGFSEFDYLNQ